MLQQLLEQLGIRDFQALSAEEKRTYEEWGRILTTSDVTIDGVKQLLAREHARANAELRKFENSKDQQIFYQVLAHLTDTLNLFIETPAAQREALRAHLKQAFKVEI